MPSPAAAPSPERRQQELTIHPASTGIRTSDRERQHVVERLHHALGEGRLDLGETDARVAAAYAACYRADLTPLLADLPDGPVPTSAASAWTPFSGSSAPPWTALFTSAVWRARVAVLGARADAQPTAAQCRSAMLLALVALAWFAACAVLGAAMVAA